MLFEEEGWDVHIYATGEAFLVDQNNHALDCIVLDPYLPGMTGADVARSIMKGNGHIPIIGLTARPNSPLAMEVINAGACMMLTKPVSAEDLIARVHAAARDVANETKQQ